jgi:hypothetical protein
MPKIGESDGVTNIASNDDDAKVSNDKPTRPRRGRAWPAAASGCAHDLLVLSAWSVLC